jgi:hypothetical protein
MMQWIRCTPGGKCKLEADLDEWGCWEDANIETVYLLPKVQELITSPRQSTGPQAVPLVTCLDSLVTDTQPVGHT